MNAWRRLPVLDRRGSVTGDGSGRKTGIDTSASEPSVWNTVGHSCISSGIRFGERPTEKLYSDGAVGDAGAVLKDRASNGGGIAISCGMPADRKEADFPRIGAADAALSGLNIDAQGLFGGERERFSSTSSKPSIGTPGDLGLCILLLDAMDAIDMAENDVPGRVAVDGRATEFTRTRGANDNGALDGFAVDDRELIVLDRRSFGLPSEGRMVGLAEPEDGIGIGAGLGARKDGVSRPVHSSRIEVTKLGARRAAGLADRDRDTGRGILDGVMENWLLCLFTVGVGASTCTDGINGF